MRIAVVAGASSGIGRAVASELCRKQAGTFDELRLVARNAEGLKRTAEMCGYANVRLVEGNLRDPETLKKAAYADPGDVVTWLVISAGTGYYGDFKEESPEQREEVIDLNCRVNAAVISAFLPLCVRGTRIVNIASAAAFSPQPGFAVYAASKAFVLSLSEAIGYELKKEGITVTAVCPGPCDTDFLKKAREGRPVPAFKQKSMTTPEKVAEKAVKAAAKGKRICVPTLRMKIARAAAGFLPAEAVMAVLYKGNGK